MISIDWRKEYKNEFLCPKCNQGDLIIIPSIQKNNNYKRRFKCSKCKKTVQVSCDLRKGYLNRRLEAYGLGCPSADCNARQMILNTISKSSNKKQFLCLVCGAISSDSFVLSKSNLSRFAQKHPPIKPFIFEDDKWDLRAINTSALKATNRYFIDFSVIKLNWFKLVCKQYIQYLCKLNTPVGTIRQYKVSFKEFSTYLIKKNISDIEEIERDLIIDFLAWSKTTNIGIRHRLGNLRQLFTTGNIQGWFKIDPDIIRDSDYPKLNPSNPDPISDRVREQIEKNLHKLPEPIARMWIICFFAAMRPGELVLLKKDCLEQAGENWNLIWDRKKGKNFHQHSIPITRTIAKVVQEQREYIENLWGKDWEYLFCHYQNISQSNLSHSRLKPVKKVMFRTNDGTPLQKAISTLIKVENIRDENGRLATFKPNLIRETRLTELFHKGHDLSVVSAWAGHRNLATTANFYTQVTCEQIEKEVGHIQSALVNEEGKKIYYESLPKSFWENPKAHELELAGTHINTPIYGYCSLELDQECQKFRACYTCRLFVPKPEKVFLYVKQRDELRDKEKEALANGHDVLVEQFSTQAERLDKIIVSVEGTT